MKTESILIVEDDPHARKLLQTLLSEQKRYWVDIAEGAAEALSLMKEKTYDLVLSDMVMEDTSGIELLRRINEHFPGTPFILMTAYGSIETAIQALELGAYAYLLKPLNHDELLLVIHRALEVNRLEKTNKRLLQTLVSARMRVGTLRASWDGPELIPGLEEIIDILDRGVHAA